MGRAPLYWGLALATVVACAGTPHTRTATHATRPVTSAERGFQQVFRRTTLDGQRMEAKAAPTVMIAFASWCNPCRRELSDLGQLRTRYPDLRIVGLNAYEEYANYSDQKRLRAFLSESAPWLREIVLADQTLLREFGGIPKIPTLFVFDKDGRTVAEFRRDKRPPPSIDELERAIVAAQRGH